MQIFHILALVSLVAGAALDARQPGQGIQARAPALGVAALAAHEARGAAGAAAAAGDGQPARRFPPNKTGTGGLEPTKTGSGKGAKKTGPGGGPAGIAGLAVPYQAAQAVAAAPTGPCPEEEDGAGGKSTGKGAGAAAAKPTGKGTGAGGPPGAKSTGGAKAPARI